jgi:hypothetical protein
VTARDRGQPQVVSGRNCLRDVYFCRSPCTLNHRQNCGSRCETTNIVSDEKRLDELEFILLYASPPVYPGCSVSANVRRREYISKNAPRRCLDEMSTSQDWQMRLDLAQRAGLRIAVELGFSCQHRHLVGRELPPVGIYAANILRPSRRCAHRGSSLPAECVDRHPEMVVILAGITGSAAGRHFSEWPPSAGASASDPALADRTYRSGFTAGGRLEPERVWQTILLCDHIGYTHIEPLPLRPRACRQ